MKLFRIILMMAICFIMIFSISGYAESKYNTESLETNSQYQEQPIPDGTIIGSYSTKILDRSKGRINNIKIAVRRINGYKLNPGETFSFNRVVGKRSRDAGFRKAKVIVNGETVLGTGGGICQVSSTLYNAAVKCDMKIVERHKHPRDVYYVPSGKDATVVYNELDFRFRNTKRYPVRIYAAVRDNKVRVKIVKSK